MVVVWCKNDKSVVGTSITDNQINEYKAEIANHTSPKLSFIDIHKVNYQGLDVLLLEIPAAPQGTPVSWKGHRYGRDGESLGGLNDYELKKYSRKLKKQIGVRRL
ncbi:MAG: ATP-binding protein [Vicingaceae bacterium]|nr:ATP-binding protein [Vicingaceae bacterium]